MAKEADFLIVTTDVTVARKFAQAITSRNCFELRQQTAYLRDYEADGVANSMSGRDIVFSAKFRENEGAASLFIYAPDSRGGILETVLQDVFPEHQGSEWIARDLGIAFGNIGCNPDGVRFSGDLGERNLDWIEEANCG